MRSLNVKNPEAHRLAAAIARETGETLTRVVTEALRERLSGCPAARGRLVSRNSRRSRNALLPLSNAHTLITRNFCTTTTAFRNDS